MELGDTSERYGYRALAVHVVVVYSVGTGTTVYVTLIEEDIKYNPPL